MWRDFWHLGTAGPSRLLLFLIGQNLILLSYVLIRRMTASLYDLETSALLTSMAYFTGISLGYLRPERIPPRLVRALFPVFLVLQLGLILGGPLLAHLLQQRSEVLAFAVLFLLTALFGTSLYSIFLPTLDVWTRRGGERGMTRVPMFPGYVFLHHALDKWSDVEVRKARGLVAILGESWERRAEVPPAEVDAIRRVTAARLPAMAHPYLREGQRVRIVEGPMTDVEGILVRTKPGKGLLVVSVELLRRSVAVVIDCTLVRPV